MIPAIDFSGAKHVSGSTIKVRSLLMSTAEVSLPLFITKTLAAIMVECSVAFTQITVRQHSLQRSSIG